MDSIKNQYDEFFYSKRMFTAEEYFRMPGIKKYILLFILLLLILPAFSQARPEPVGKILSVRNDVQITRAVGNKDIRAEEGTLLYAGDSIESGENSSLAFSLNEKDIFELGESSEVQLDEMLLFSEEEEYSPLIRHTLGFLRSIIRSSKESTQPLIHTPTMVAGVRGTAFETLVSLDSTTALVVDEGTVEMDYGKEKILLNQGQMAETDVHSQSVKTRQAPSAGERNWKEWQEMRKKDLIPKIPLILSAYRHKAEEWSEQYQNLLSEIREEEQKLKAQIGIFTAAAKQKEAETYIASAEKLDMQLKELKKKLGKSRHRINRFKAIGRHVKKVGIFAWLHKRKLEKKEQKEIEQHLAYFQEKGRQLKADTEFLIKALRRTLRDAHKTIRKSERYKKATERRERLN